ncbi:sulfide:quinone oxidoreductase [Candidatus Kryptobacter tengchongensis]|nr:sulfide:quinone oxidoreductase [Candidatus Kryptobacter tengchongensis]CUU09906.1 sulfide:quinone oxidoreductase [Candidatus Kryptobacter tengchongensis]
MAKILILGGSFAGLTAAFDLKRKLKDKADVTVISKAKNFVFIPSLIWVPFGWRKPEDISLELKPILENKGINFVHAEATKIIPEKNQVETTAGIYNYDFLLIATGPDLNFSEVEGLGPHDGYTTSICTIDHALHAGEKWKEFVKNPGPIVIGATQKASCFGAAYEYVFNIEYAARKAGIRDKVSITFVTSEPFLANFGIGGVGNSQKMTEFFFKKLNIRGITNVAIEKISEDKIYLSNGEVLPYKYAMIIPPFLGVKAVRDSGLGNESGFIPVDDTYKHIDYDNIYAAGVAVAVKYPEPTPIPIGVPKTGYMSEVMARVAADNITSKVLGVNRAKKLPFADIAPLCVMDAGNMGVLFIASRIFKPRKYHILFPGPWSHWIKVWFEKYYLWKVKNGYSQLP